VGSNKYQQRRTGSATSTVCIDFGVEDQTLLAIAELANQNNLTGNLKSYSPKLGNPGTGRKWIFSVKGGKTVETTTDQANWSIVWLLREAYKVGWDVNDVIRHVHAVLDAWYEVMQNNGDMGRWNRRVSQPGRIQNLWNLFGAPKVFHNDNPCLPRFSVPWLVWSLSIQGDEQLEVSADRIAKEVEWWISLQELVINMRIEAREWALEQTSEKNVHQLDRAGYIFRLQKEPDILCGYFTATEVQSRELWNVSFGRSQHADSVDLLLDAIFGTKKSTVMLGMLIIQNPKTTQVAILAGPKALDFGGVYARLVGVERQKRGETPARSTKVWHLDEKGEPGRKRHWLLNGSDNWPLTPTIIDIPIIIQLVKESAKSF